MRASSTILKAFSNLFFPEICYGCGSDLVSKHQLLCLRCLSRLPYTRFERIRNNPVEKIFWGRMPIQQAASVLYFTKGSILEKLLHQLKYRGKREVGFYCGRMMGEALRKSFAFASIDAIIPLPLFKKKEHQRGFNQAKLICDGIADILAIPVINDAIERVEATETQTHKNRIERWKNMQHRFQLRDQALIANKHVMLVDDVITTGATLESCGTELLKGDSVKLSILTLAYSSSKNV